MIQALALSLASTLPLPVGVEGEGQSQEPVLAVYDLSAILPRIDQEGWYEALVVPPAYASSPLRNPNAKDFYSRPSADIVLQIIGRALDDEILDRGRDLTLQGESSLLLMAPPATHQRAKAVLDALAEATSASVVMRVDVLTFTDGAGELPARSVIDAGEANRIISNAKAQGAHHEGFDVELSAGRTTALGDRRSVSYVYDYDVEIAQGSIVHDPIMVKTEEGLRVVMRAAPAPGGLALSCLLVESQLLGPVRVRPVDIVGHAGDEKTGVQKIDGPQSLQVADILLNSVALDTFVPDGKALVLGSEMDLEDASRRTLTLLRRVEGELPTFASHPIPGTGRRLLVVNSELFRRPWMTAANSWWDGETWGAASGLSHPVIVAGLRAEPSHFLLGWMRRFVAWDRFGPWILVVTDRSWDGDAEKELQALVQGMTAPRLVEAQVALRSAGKAPFRMRLPVTEGTETGLMLGRTGSALVDYYTEVAHFAGAADPVVIPLFDGLALVLGIARGTGASRILEMRGSAHLVQRPLNQISIDGAMVRGIDQVRSELLQADERRSLELSDGATHVTLGAQDGRGLSVSVSLR